MEKPNPNHQPQDEGIIRFFRLFTELLGWLQIMASPLLVGLIIGAFIYLSNPTTLTLIIGISIAGAGLILGIVWATKQWKGKGTIWFMSRAMATPELDKPTEESQEEIIHNDKQR